MLLGMGRVVAGLERKDRRKSLASGIEGNFPSRRDIFRSITFSYDIEIP